MTAADYFCTKCSALMDATKRCGACHLCPKCCKCIPKVRTKGSWSGYTHNHPDDDHEEFVSDNQEEPNDLVQYD